MVHLALRPGPVSLSGPLSRHASRALPSSRSLPRYARGSISPPGSVIGGWRLTAAGKEPLLPDSSRGQPRWTGLTPPTRQDRWQGRGQWPRLGGPIGGPRLSPWPAVTPVEGVWWDPAGRQTLTPAAAFPPISPPETAVFSSSQTTALSLTAPVSPGQTAPFSPGQTAPFSPAQTAPLSPGQIVPFSSANTIPPLPILPNQGLPLSPASPSQPVGDALFRSSLEGRSGPPVAGGATVPPDVRVSSGAIYVRGAGEGTTESARGQFSGGENRGGVGLSSEV